MDRVVTLEERHGRRLDAMVAALPLLDVALSDYARTHGGRFIRFGSSAKGRMRVSSDVDVLADFPDQAAAVAACDAADAVCVEHGLVPDCRPSAWCSEALVARARAEGVILP